MKNTRIFFLSSLFLLAFCVFGIGQSSVSEVSGNSVEVTYEGATVYTGKTDYAFKNANGRLIQFSYSNLGEAEPWNPTLPDNMLETKVDGVPGPNPELVGKTFLLVYSDEGDMVKEVRLKE